MAIRQRGNAWQVDVQWKGIRAPRVAVPTRDEALKLEAQFKADLMAGKPITYGQASVTRSKSDVSTMGALLDYTIRHYWKGMKAEETQARQGRLVVEAFGDDFPVAAVDKLQIDRVAEEWAVQGLMGSTINRKLTALRVMLKQAHELGAITSVPKIKLKKEYETRLRYFTDDEEASLLSYFADDPDLRDALVIGLDLGYRQAEIFGLQVQDYVDANGKLHLWETKTDSPRANPVTGRVLEIVKRRSRGKSPTESLLPSIDRKEISRRMGRWKKHEGLPENDPACFHTTRHTCCTRLMLAGVPIKTIMKWMGHKDIETTLRYSQFVPEHLDVALSALEKRVYPTADVLPLKKENAA